MFFFQFHRSVTLLCMPLIKTFVNNLGFHFSCISFMPPKRHSMFESFFTQFTYKCDMGHVAFDVLSG